MSDDDLGVAVFAGPPRDASVISDSFRKLVEQSVDGVLVVDRRGRVQFANRSACELLRKPACELLGYELGCPGVADGPVEIVIAPGSDRPTATELRAVSIEWEGRAALLVNLRDVTSRRLQQQRISELNTDLRVMLELKNLILRADEPQALLSGACEILTRHQRCSAAALVLYDSDGKAWWGAESPDNGQQPSLRRRLQPGALSACCVRALEESDVACWVPADDGCACRPSGADHAAGVHFVARIDSEGALYGFLDLVVARELSEDPGETDFFRRYASDLAQGMRSLLAEAARREAEQSLRESEERFRRLFENSIDAIVVADEQGRCTHVNAAACEMFGRSREDLLATSVANLSVPEGHPSAGDQFDAYLDSAEEQAGTFAFVHADGSPRVAEYSAFKLSPTRFVSILREATERRELEAQLRQAQKMEAVGALAGGVAHDFNNLLTAIISFAGFVRDATPPADPRREDIGEVLRAADRASSLTRQLLAFSRRQPIAPKTIDLNELLRDMHRLLCRTLGEDVQIDARLDGDLWPVLVDPGQFEQVVLNLAVNAREAMPRGGRLTIETRNERDPAAGQGWVLLRMTDTGAGMSDEIRSQIFEPFFTTKDSGTGLGLSMVYGLVAQADGRISVDSRPGCTCFEIRLPPVAPKGQAAVSTVAHQATPGSGETILVIEDERLVRRAAVRILSHYGYHVLEASDGVEAVERSAELAEAVDLVLCDVIMPGLDGAQTVEALRARRPDLKVLFMTGYTDNAVLHRGVLDPHVELLLKPFSEEGLLTRVRQLLGQRPSATA